MWWQRMSQVVPQGGWGPGSQMGHKSTRTLGQQSVLWAEDLPLQGHCVPSLQLSRGGALGGCDGTEGQASGGMATWVPALGCSCQPQAGVCLSCHLDAGNVCVQSEHWHCPLGLGWRADQEQGWERKQAPRVEKHRAVNGCSRPQEGWGISPPSGHGARTEGPGCKSVLGGRSTAIPALKHRVQHEACRGLPFLSLLPCLPCLPRATHFHACELCKGSC